MDKQDPGAQGTIGNLLRNAIMENNIKKRIYMCKTESFCPTAEIDTTL